MASPFSKYTGEQVPQTNILPAYTEMARQRYESIAGFGKDIANALTKYQAKNDERQKNSMFAANTIAEFLEAPEELTDEQDRPNAPVLSATAPSHIARLYKKAESEGNGDWVSGLSGVSGLELEAFLEMQAKYKVEDRQRKEDAFRDAGFKLQQAGHQLQVDRFGVDKKRAELDYDAALFALSRAKSTSASQDELIALQISAEKAKQAFAALANPVELDAKIKTGRLLDLELQGKTRLEDAAKGIEAIKRAEVPTSKTETFIYPEKKIAGQVLIKNPDGSEVYQDSGDIEAILKQVDPSLTLRDIDADGLPDAVKAVEGGAIAPEIQIARKLTGDASYEVGDKSSTAKFSSPNSNAAFTKSMYDFIVNNAARLGMSPEQIEMFKKDMLINPTTGKPDASLGGNTNSAAQYEKMAKWFKSPTVQGLLSEQFKPVPMYSKADKITVMYASPYVSEGSTTKTTNINEKEVWRAKFAKVKSEFDAAKKPFYLTERDMFKAIGVFGNYTPMKMPNGTEMWEAPDGKLITEEEFLRLGSRQGIKEPKTEWEAKQMIHNNFLQGYLPEVKKDASGKVVAVEGGKDLGNGYNMYFVGNRKTPIDPAMPVNSATNTNFDKTVETVAQLETDILKSDKFVDNMLNLWDEAGPLDASVLIWFGGRWGKQYTAQQRGLETFRKYFLAPGTETEKDADRLADLMAAPSFAGWRNKDVMKETLEIARSLIVEGMRIEAETKGFVLTKDGQPIRSMTPEERTANRARIAQLNGVSYPTTPTK